MWCVCVSPYCWVRFWVCVCIEAFGLLEPKWRKHLEFWELLRGREREINLNMELFDIRGVSIIRLKSGSWGKRSVSFVCVCGRPTSLSVQWSRSGPQQGASWCYCGNNGAAAAGWRDWDQQSGKQLCWQFWQYYWTLIVKQCGDTLKWVSRNTLLMINLIHQ